jgi:uncharacterized protein YcgI (DUF1989 family)
MGIETVLLGAALSGMAASGFQAYTAHKEKKEIEHQTRQNVATEQANTAEKQKQVKEQATRRDALARARASASGVRSSGTVATYMDALKKETDDELNWIKRVGDARVGQTQSSGNLAASKASSAMWGSIGSMLTSASNSYTTGYELGVFGG